MYLFIFSVFSGDSPNYALLFPAPLFSRIQLLEGESVACREYVCKMIINHNRKVNEDTT